MQQHNLISHSHPWINNSDTIEIQNNLNSGMISNGSKVKDFESSICEYINSKYAFSQTSGTMALILALKTLEVSIKDEVIIPSYVCKSVLDAVVISGAKPVLCDVDNYGVINSESVSKCYTNKTKAIIAVHIFGNPCDIKSLKKSFSVPVIEDACQAFGLSIENNLAGSLGDIGFFSFHATKCLTTGEGGMLVTDCPIIAERASSLTKYESIFKYSPLTDIQASLGISQLNRYSDFLNQREEIKERYVEASKNHGIPIGVNLNSNMLFRFTLKTDKPFDKIESSFMNLGISVRHGVDLLLHRLLGLDDSLFPGTVDLFRQTISIPFYPSLKSKDQDRVIEGFKIINGN